MLEVHTAASPVDWIREGLRHYATYPDDFTEKDCLTLAQSIMMCLPEEETRRTVCELPGLAFFIEEETGRLSQLLLATEMHALEMVVKQSLEYHERSARVITVSSKFRYFAAKITQKLWPHRVTTLDLHIDTFLEASSRSAIEQGVQIHNIPNLGGAVLGFAAKPSPVAESEFELTLRTLLQLHIRGILNLDDPSVLSDIELALVSTGVSSRQVRRVCAVVAAILAER